MPDAFGAWGDQAAGLRRLFGGRSPQVIAFASGREACGRTTLLVQTAAALAAAGHGVVIIDENQAADNAVSAFGLAARYDLIHAIHGDRNLRQVAVEAAPMIHIVPAGRAAREIDHQRDPQLRARMHACLRDLQRGAGFVLIDAAIGRTGQLSPLALAARHVALVVTAQSTAITHAYAMIKRLAQEGRREDFQVVVTRARSHEESRAIFDNMRRVAREHLDVRLHYLGESPVPVTDHIAEELLTKLPVAHDDGDGDGFVWPAPRPARRRGGLTAADSVV